MSKDVICACSLVVGLVASSAAVGAEQLTIVLTADDEGHVGPCHSCPGTKGLGGLDRRAVRVGELKREKPDALLLDAGNALFGGDSLRSDGEVIVAAYSKLGYDALNLTDRDFFRGKQKTLDLIEQAEFPFVSANLVDSDSGELVVKPFLVKEVDGEKIAIIGVTQRPRVLDMKGYVPPALAGLRKQLQGVDFRKADEALAKWLPRAKAQSDRVILMYYGSGFGLRSIRRKFGDQVDAICVGGIRPDQAPKDGKPPVVATSMHGRHLAHATIAADGTAKIEQIAIDASIEPDPEMQELLAKYITTRPPPESVADATKPMVPVPDPKAERPEPGKHTARAPEMKLAPLVRKPAEDGKSGIEIGGRFPDDRPPKYLSIYKAGSDEKVTYLRERWGFIPLEPGKYEVRITPGALGKNKLPWTEVEVVPGEVTSISIDTGIELTGRDEKSPAPKYWSIYKPGKDEALTYATGGWGFMPLPPGKYEVRITPGAFGKNKLPWTEVEVVPGEVTSISIDTGIELTGRTPNDPPPRNWSIYPAGSDDYLTYVSGGWGFTPLLPGDYEVRFTAGRHGEKKMPWGSVTVKPGEVAQVRLSSGVELEAPDFFYAPPERWLVHDAETDAMLTSVSAGWTFSPLPPGNYYVTCSYGGKQGKSKPIVVAKDRTVALTLADLGIEPPEMALEKRTGIALTSGFHGEPPPAKWFVDDVSTGKRIATVGSPKGRVSGMRGSHSGFMPLPTGKYRVSLLPSGYGAKEILWREVEVAAGEVVRVDVDSGVKLAGRTADDTPPAKWFVQDAETNKTVAQSGDYNNSGNLTGCRWGFTPLPPGNYRVAMRPRGRGAKEISWREIEITAGNVVRVDVDSGVELVGRSPGDAPPPIWLVYDAKTEEQVAQVGGYSNAGRVTGSRWGFTPLPPGDYRVATTYGGAGGKSAPVKLKPGEIKRIPLGDLQLSEVNIELPAAQHVRLASASNKIQVQIVAKSILDAWKQTAQRESIELNELLLGSANDKYDGLLHRIRVTDVRRKYRVHPFYDAGFDDSSEYGGHKNLRPGYWVYVEPHWYIWGDKLEPDNRRGSLLTTINLGEKGDTRTHVRQWVPIVGEASILIRSGDLLLETPVNLRGDKINDVAFDAASLAKRHELEWFRVASSGATRIMTMDASGNRLLALDQDPTPAQSWLAPARSIVRLQEGKRESLHIDIPTGELTSLDMESQRIVGQKSSRKIQVDIAIQTPQEGTIVEADRIKVTGRASTTGPAGSTRVAIILDASGSAVEDSSGAGLDGDGKEENILEAEVAAARTLLNELAQVESRAPGKTFDVAILRFADKSDVMAPLLPLNDPTTPSKLNAALDQILKDGRQGGTNFEPVINQTLELFQQSERAGPAVMVFMSDGYPIVSLGRGTRSAAPEGFNAAARAGLQGVEFHAIGLGKDFQSSIEAELGFPPYPAEDDGAAIIAHMAACGSPSSTATALPKPADVVKVVSRLPVVELPEAELKEVRVVNVTTAEPAFSVQLDRNGFFEADVPVSLVPVGKHDWNTLEATAIAKDERYTATDRVRIRGKRDLVPTPFVDDTRRKETTRSAATNPDVPPDEDVRVPITFQPDLTPAIQLVLDSSGSMLKKSGDEAKYIIAERVVESLVSRLPDETPVGFRLYGHLGFWTRPESPRPGYPSRRDPRWLKDSELVACVSPLDSQHRNRIKHWLDWAHPRGLTPLVYSLLEAKNNFPSTWKGPKIIILVSDGKETCGGDLDDVAEAFIGSDVVVHVVGFDIDDEEVGTTPRRRPANLRKHFKTRPAALAV
jgi:hypothetical protein